MEKIKEKMTLTSADGKVTFCLTKQSNAYLYDCFHLDIDDDVKELRLDIPGMTTLALSEEHIFPNVREIYIGKEMQNIIRMARKTAATLRQRRSLSRN